MDSSILNLGEFDAAKAAAQEEVKVRHTRGRGRFSKDKRYITLAMKMYLPGSSPDGYGTPDGEHFGVWEAQFSDPKALFNRPAPPAPPMNQPVGPVQHLTPSAQTKAIWTFEDGSSIYAIGPAMSHLIQLDDGSFLFLVCCAQTITGGTGRYAGAAGLKTSLGSTHIPANVNLFGPGDVEFEAQTVDTFRIFRGSGNRTRDQPSSEQSRPQAPSSPNGLHNSSYPNSPDQNEYQNGAAGQYQGSRPELGREYPPPGEEEAIQEITQIHLKLMQAHPGFRGPHRKAQGCVAVLFHVRDDIPEHLRVGIFRSARSYLGIVRYSNGGSDDDTKPDAHAMAIKLTGIIGERLLPEEVGGETQDFILCDNPVFVVRDVREMVEFEQAKILQVQFSGTPEEFAQQYPRPNFLLTRFAKSGFLKPAKGTPFAAEYWSQTPSAYGDGRAVQYFVRPWPQNDLELRPGTSPNFLREAMHKRLVVEKKLAYFDFCVVCQTDPVRMPIEDPMVRWSSGPENTVTLATVEILPLPFESPEQMNFCEALSNNPWHGVEAHRPLGGINRARRVVYLTTSKARHEVSHAPRREPVEGDIRDLWKVPKQYMEQVTSG
jgi:hypothetical protein